MHPEHQHASHTDQQVLVHHIGDPVGRTVAHNGGTVRITFRRPVTLSVGVGLVWDAGYEWVPAHDEDWRRALDVQAALWRGGQVRAVGFPDLLVAAVAERERITVIHYDSDYELIAQVTGQPVTWVVPRGTVP